MDLTAVLSVDLHRKPSKKNFFEREIDKYLLKKIQKQVSIDEIALLLFLKHFCI